MKKTEKAISRYPTKEDIEEYKKAHKEILEKFERGFISPEKYKEFFEKHNLAELIPKVIGWCGICENCFTILSPPQFDLTLLDTTRCKKTKSNELCYIFSKKNERGKTKGIRCRNVKLDNRKCRNIAEELSKWEHDPVSRRWHFLQDYINAQQVKSNKRYCSPKCKKQVQNKKGYISSILRDSSI